MQKPTVSKSQRDKGKVFLGGYVDKELADQVEEVVQEDKSVFPSASQVIRVSIVQFLKQRKASAA